MDATLVVFFLILVIITASSQTSPTCTNIKKENFISLGGCVVEDHSITCDVPRIAPLYEDSNRTATFKVIEQANISETSIQFCMGLIAIKRRNITDEGQIIMSLDVGFNTTMAVGFITANRSCWNIFRSSKCLSEPKILQEIFQLSIIQYSPVGKAFWNFEARLYGPMMGWFLSMEVFNGDGESCNIASDWIPNIQNTSIRELTVACTNCPTGKDGLLLKDMPYLKKLHLSSFCIRAFHNDSFIGMPNLVDLLLQGSGFTSFPTVIGRLEKLKTLDISYNEIEDYDFYTSKTLTSLHNLESLDMSLTRFTNPVFDKFPVIYNLKFLNLRINRLQTLEENAFQNVSAIQILKLNENSISSIHNETFVSLHKLMFLDLSKNMLTTWPIIYFCSLRMINLSYNKLTGLINPTRTGTTVDIVDISHNNISEWDNVNIFSYNSNRSRINFIEGFVDDENRTIFNNTQKYSSMHECNKTTQYLNYHFVSKSVSEQKGEMNDSKWVKLLNISDNHLTKFTDIMKKSIDGMYAVKLYSNPFDCADCTIPEFLKWINTTKTDIIRKSRILCYQPFKDRNKPVTDIEFDLDVCLIKGPNYWILAGIPLGIGVTIFLTLISVYFRYESQIVYMLHLYKIRKQKIKTTNRDYNFDAFVCYSGQDRRFVLKVLAPFLESCPERYKLCLHERDFVLGSHIIDNIVGAIEHSRKTILILSPYFINSKWCNWELEMANHKMFDDDKQFLILIQVRHIDRDKIPRHLKFYMDTRTFLTWKEDASESAVGDMCRQLKNSLGKSIFQSSSERAPLLAGATQI